MQTLEAPRRQTFVDLARPHPPMGMPIIQNFAGPSEEYIVNSLALVGGIAAAQWLDNGGSAQSGGVVVRPFVVRVREMERAGRVVLLAGERAIALPSIAEQWQPCLDKTLAAISAAGSDGIGHSDLCAEVGDFAGDEHVLRAALQVLQDERRIVVHRGGSTWAAQRYSAVS